MPDNKEPTLLKRTPPAPKFILPKEFWHNLRRLIPELFSDNIVVKTPSKLYAQFLPQAAIENPDNVWGAFGELPPSQQKQTIILNIPEAEIAAYQPQQNTNAFASGLEALIEFWELEEPEDFDELDEFDEPEHVEESEQPKQPSLQALIKLHNHFNLLQRLGFEVLMMTNDGLQSFDMQWFHQTTSKPQHQPIQQVRKQALAEHHIAADKLCIIASLSNNSLIKNIGHISEYVRYSQILDNERAFNSLPQTITHLHWPYDQCPLNIKNKNPLQTYIQTILPVAMNILNNQDLSTLITYLTNFKKRSKQKALFYLLLDKTKLSLTALLKQIPTHQHSLIVANLIPYLSFLKNMHCTIQQASGYDVNQLAEELAHNEKQGQPLPPLTKKNNSENNLLLGADPHTAVSYNPTAKLPNLLCLKLAPQALSLKRNYLATLLPQVQKLVLEDGGKSYDEETLRWIKENIIFNQLLVFENLHHEDMGFNFNAPNLVKLSLTISSKDTYHFSDAPLLQSLSLKFRDDSFSHIDTKVTTDKILFAKHNQITHLQLIFVNCENLINKFENNFFTNLLTQLPQLTHIKIEVCCSSEENHNILGKLRAKIQQLIDFKQYPQLQINYGRLNYHNQPISAAATSSAAPDQNASTADNRPPTRTATSPAASDQNVYIATNTGQSVQLNLEHKPFKKSQYKLQSIGKRISETKQPIKRPRFQCYSMDENFNLQKLEPNQTLSTPLKIPTKTSLKSFNLKDSSHDYYQFHKTITLKKGCYFTFTSMSLHDEISLLLLDGKPLGNDAIILQKNNLGHIEMHANKALRGNLTYVIDAKKVTKHHLPQKVKDIIDHLKSFSSTGNDNAKLPKKATTAEERNIKLQAMYEQSVGRCSERSLMFLHQLYKLKRQQPNNSIYQNIDARAVNISKDHMLVEISMNGKPYCQYCLGGYEADKKIIKRPTTNAAILTTNAAILTTNAAILKTIAQLQTQQKQPSSLTSALQTMFAPSPNGKNYLVPVKDDTNLQNLIEQAKHKANHAKRPIFVINSAQVLQQTLKRITCDLDKQDQPIHCRITDEPGGELHQFINKTKKAGTNPPIIIIDWTNIPNKSAYNEVYNANNRMIANNSLSNSTTLISLHVNNSKYKKTVQSDSTICSRYKESGGIYDLSSIDIDEVPAVDATESVPDGATSIHINLHHSPRWKDIFYGHAKVDGDRLIWESGYLSQLQKVQSIQNIIFVNAPNDPAFNELIDQLSSNKSLYLLDHKSDLKRKFRVHVVAKPFYPSIEPIDVIHYKDPEAKKSGSDTIMLNSETIEQTLHSKHVTENRMYTTQGILRPYRNKPLTIFITDQLSNSQWSLFINKIAELNINLKLIVTDHAHVPSAIPHHIITKISQHEPSKKETLASKSKHKLYYSEYIDETVATIKTLDPSKTVITIDISGLTLDDLICQTDYKLEGSVFTFKQQISDIINALTKGDDVILKGHCSEQVMNGLATFFTDEAYLYFNGEKLQFKGSLHVVTNNLKACPSWLPVQYPTPIKKQTQTSAKPSVTLGGDLEAIDDDLSEQAANNFAQHRQQSIQTMLNTSKHVLLEGMPGTGKSTLIRSLAHNDAIKVYYEHQILAWMHDQDELIDSDHPEKGFQLKVLVCDEVNLKQSHRMGDKDLLNDPPSYYHAGQYAQFEDKNHSRRILYAQNPTSLGGGRRDIALFSEAPHSKYEFKFLPKAFVLHHILKPIFAVTGIDKQTAEEKATQLVTAIKGKITDVRPLINQAIKQSTQHFQTSQSITKDCDLETKIVINKKSYMMTQSRLEIYQTFQKIMQARSFRQQLFHSTQPTHTIAHHLDTAIYGGKTGMILTGDAALGKSVFWQATMAHNNFTAQTEVIADDAFNANTMYYTLKASDPIEKQMAILHTAFDQGAILFIDEIDMCPKLNALLHAYTTGEDPDGKRPKQAGFTLIGAMNGASFTGRSDFSESFYSRVEKVQMQAYSINEVINIFQDRYKEKYTEDNTFKEEMIRLFAEWFDDESQKPLDEPITLRELETQMDEYFKYFTQFRSNKHLTKQQHLLLFQGRKSQGFYNFLNNNLYRVTASTTIDQIIECLKNNSNLRSVQRQKTNPKLSKSKQIFTTAKSDVPPIHNLEQYYQIFSYSNA